MHPRRNDGLVMFSRVLKGQRAINSTRLASRLIVQSPIWVNLDRIGLYGPCPLFPLQRSSSGHHWWSVWCQQATSEHYSITSSARRSMEVGSVKFRTSAVFKFTTKSNRVGRSAGNSEGFAPFKIFPAITAVPGIGPQDLARRKSALQRGRNLRTGKFPASGI